MLFLELEQPVRIGRCWTVLGCHREPLRLSVNVKTVNAAIAREDCKAANRVLQLANVSRPRTGLQEFHCGRLNRHPPSILCLELAEKAFHQQGDVFPSLLEERQCNLNDA